METKQVKISGKKFIVHGNSKDRYFNEYVVNGKDFFDVPVAFIEKFLRDDGVLIDIGANIGIVSCSAATVAPNGKVIAFEASKKIHAYANKTIRVNKVKNVELHHLALSNKKRTLSFFEDDDFLAGSRVVDSKSAGKIVKVAAVSLDSFVRKNNVERIDMVKLDVEGHEEEVLNGAKKTLSRFKPICLIEFNAYSMILINRTLPQDFYRKLKSIFPTIYVFDRKTMGITDISSHEAGEEFLRQNLLNGCVDDLVCTFEELPGPGEWFIEQGKKAERKAKKTTKKK